MSQANALAILTPAATVLGIAMALAPVPQIKLMLRARQSADVSLSTFAVILAGVITWLAYGIALNNSVLIITEIIGVVTNSITVFLILRYRRTAGPVAPTREADGSAVVPNPDPKLAAEHSAFVGEIWSDIRAIWAHWSIREREAGS